MLCVLVLYSSGEIYSLKSAPSDRFLWNFSLPFYLFSKFLLEIYWEEIAEEIDFLYFILISSVGLKP